MRPGSSEAESQRENFTIREMIPEIGTYIHTLSCIIIVPNERWSS